MKIVQELANLIIKEARSVIREHFIVVDPSFTIIACSDQSRVGTFHEGAKVAITEKRTLFITEDLADQLQGVKPGINLPIYHQHEIIGVLGITGNPEQVQPFAELLKRMTELLIHQAYQAEQLEWKTRGLESYVYEWAHSTSVNHDFIERGEILGISMSEPYLVIMLQLQKSEPTVSEQNKIIEWFHYNPLKHKNDFLIRWGQGRFTWLKNSSSFVDREQLQQLLKSWSDYVQRNIDCSLYIGVGKTETKQLINQSYHEAAKALKVSSRTKQITFYDDLLLDIILQDVPQQSRDEFSSHILDQLEPYPDLVATMRMYLNQNLSKKKTAESLAIHVNTLLYRLQQIKELTTIDPKTTEGITLFYLALTFEVWTV